MGKHEHLDQGWIINCTLSRWTAFRRHYYTLHLPLAAAAPSDTPVCTGLQEHQTMTETIASCPSPASHGTRHTSSAAVKHFVTTAGRSGFTHQLYMLENKNYLLSWTCLTLVGMFSSFCLTGNTTHFSHKSIKGDYKLLLSIYYLLIQMAILGWTVPLSSNISYSGRLAQSTSMGQPFSHSPPHAFPDSSNPGTWN